MFSGLVTLRGWMCQLVARLNENVPLEKPMQYMQKMVVDSVVVTTSDGKLFELLKREDVERRLSEQEKQNKALESKR